VRFGEIDSRHAIYKIEKWNEGDGFDESLLERFGPCANAANMNEYFISLRFPNSHPATQSEYEAFKQQSNG
jgi:hypothetical protein